MSIAASVETMSTGTGYALAWSVVERSGVWSIRTPTRVSGQVNPWLTAALQIASKLGVPFVRLPSSPPPAGVPVEAADHLPRGVDLLAEDIGRVDERVLAVPDPGLAVVQDEPPADHRVVDHEGARHVGVALPEALRPLLPEEGVLDPMAVLVGHDVVDD